MDKIDIVLEEMNKYEADGVDFIPVFSDSPIVVPYCSYTREEWIASNRSYPKSGRRYWKWDKGQKVVVSPQRTTPALAYAFTADGDYYNKETAEKIFTDLFAEVGFDGHNVVIYKNDLIEIAKKYGVEVE